MFTRKDGFAIRPLKADDLEMYYEEGFHPLDPAVVYFTGGTADFSKEEIRAYLNKISQDSSRFDFAILNPQGRIIGEVVINEIDQEVRQANFRILLFSQAYRHRGIGSWATNFALDFAFQELNLHRLSLEVFSYNQAAQAMYRKVGFKEEGRLRHAILDGENDADLILMAILEEDYHQLRTGGC